MLNDFILGRNSNLSLWRNRCPQTVEDIVPAAFSPYIHALNVKLKARRAAVGGDPVFHFNIECTCMCQVFLRAAACPSPACLLLLSRPTHPDVLNSRVMRESYLPCWAQNCLTTGLLVAFFEGGRAGRVWPCWLWSVWLTSSPDSYVQNRLQMSYKFGCWRRQASAMLGGRECPENDCLLKLGNHFGL